MKPSFLTLSFILSFLISSTIFAADFNNISLKEETPFLGDPAIEKLSSSLQKSSFFDPSPAKNANVLLLQSHDAQNGQYYSQYKITPLRAAGSRTYYRTYETVQNGHAFQGIPQNDPALVKGQGISFGGLFWPLEKMEVINPAGKTVYLNKIAITSVQPISGSLFPLKVGNILKFKFTRTHSQFLNGHSTVTKEVGIMEYSVIAKTHYQTEKGKTVPGDIYTLNVSESTNLHPKAYLTDQYDYAPTLGWYINDRYYNQNNQMIASYQLIDWE